jgi:hypothetical protein
MILSELELDSMQEMSRESRWGKGTEKDRRTYRDSSGLWYKVWGREYRPDCYIQRDRWCSFASETGMPSFFLSGLYNCELSGAFVDHISDDDGFIRGYITREGVHPDFVPDEFCLQVFELGLSVGYLCSDLTEMNVVEVGGRLSLIDYDSHIVCCEELDPGFQREHGVLRPFLPEYYRRLVADKFSLD